MNVAPDQDTLAVEQARRPRAGVAAIVAGLLTLASGIGSQLLFGGGPGGDRIDFVEALRSRVVEGRPAGAGLLARTIEYLGDNLAVFLATGVLLGVAALLYLLPLGLLFRAIRARNPATSRLAAILVVVGTVGTGIGLITQNVFTAVEIASFSDLPVAERTSGAARDAVRSDSTQAAALINTIGRFALGTGIVLVALNAMKVGLLTRFLGVLGILVGATVILPLDQIGLVRSFWFVMLGLLMLERLPRLGTLPAWRTGRAEPWPSQQKRREAARDAAAAADGPTGNDDVARPEPAAAAFGDDETRAARRKRKRRSR